MQTSTKLYAGIGIVVLVALMDGMTDSCIGPALRDLQCIFNVTLQEVSLFQPVITAGRVIGALLFLKIPLGVNTYGVAAASITVAGCLLAVVPVLPSFWLALGLSGAVGLAHGVSVHARMLLSGELSKQRAAAIHITNLATAVGSIAGPLVISPFLSDSVSQSNTGQALHHGNMTFIVQNSTEPAFLPGNMTFIAQNSTEPAFLQGNMTFIAQNSTEPAFLQGNMAFIAQSGTKSVFHHEYMTCTTQKTNERLMNQICSNFNSDLTYGLLLLALFGVVVFSAYLLAHRVFQDDICMNEPNEMRMTISLIDGIFFIFFIAYTIICGPMVFVYGHFLPTFGIYCKLQADTRQMTNMSLSFYVCTMFGRLFGTLSSLAVSQTVQINVCTICGITVSAMLIYISELNTTWLWVGTSILAGVSSPVVSALDTWALEVNRHRPILYSIASIGDMAGYSVMSLLTGQLMAYLCVQMLNYVMSSVLLLQMVFVICLYLTVRVSKRANLRHEDYTYIE